jgi:phosphopantothenoylcysteine decarboxylase/phosphopantothenate--cysteine ligase
VQVVMTQSATHFVQPLTFQALSRHRVYTSTFEEAETEVIAHIDLADHADLVIIAPATANVMAKMAHGLADDMLSTILLATRAPIWLAPAMNGHMLAHPAVQDNLKLLTARGIQIISGEAGQLACGYVGEGRMAEPELIIKQVEQFFHSKDKHSESSTAQLVASENGLEGLKGLEGLSLDWWKGKRVLITAGPTQEPLDPVRYLSNYSSGKMGYHLAEQAVLAGARVTLVSGPVALQRPAVDTFISVTSAEEMYHAVLRDYASCDVVIKAAAVADYRPEVQASQKIKRKEEALSIKLVKNPDILKQLGEQKQHQLLIGFAAETEQIEGHARQKLERKNLDFIVANDVTADGAGFEKDTNIVTIYGRQGEQVKLPQLSKQETARRILETVAHYANT